MCKTDVYNNRDINHIDKTILYVQGLGTHFAENYIEIIQYQLIDLLNEIRPYYNAGLMWYHDEKQKKAEVSREHS